MRYWVRVYRQRADYSAMVPDLPGCVAAGDSLDEVLQLFKEAIVLHLELMQKTGEKAITPTRHVDLDVEELEDGEISAWVEIKSTRKATRRKQRVGNR
jgi:predicted RNase H-like HicB family nuclease